MQLISEAMTAGLLEKVSEADKPTEQHHEIARTLMTAGGTMHGMNRAQRRALQAIERKEGPEGRRVRLERERASRGKVPA